MPYLRIRKLQDTMSTKKHIRNRVATPGMELFTYIDSFAIHTATIKTETDNIGGLSRTLRKQRLQYKNDSIESYFFRTIKTDEQNRRAEAKRNKKYAKRK